MSDRIHLNIVNKKKFKEYLKSYNDEDGSHYLLGRHIEGGKSIEVFDELPIDQYRQLFKDDEDEYCPYIITKNKIRGILKFYQKSLLSNAENKIKDMANIIKAVNLNDKFSDESISKIMVHFRSYRLHHEFLKLYFEGLIKDDTLVQEDGQFLLDYYYILDMYNTFDSKRDIAIITHG